MKTLKAELSNNFDTFHSSLPIKIEKTFDELLAHKEKYSESYIRISTLQAWKSELFTELSLGDELQFFHEAHNDAIMSHSLAMQGAWRVALMCQRSLLENIVYFLYYVDHPVELLLWKEGSHRLGFSETIKYLSLHPSFNKLPDSVTGIPSIKKEYAELSKAVHASSSSFRVTSTGNVEGLNSSSSENLGMWATREKHLIVALNKLLIVFFQKHLKGAAKLNLRKSISLVLSTRTARDQIKSKLAITLKDSTTN